MTSTTNPRIIIIDKRQDTFHFVRSAMELLERRPRMVQVSAAEDALVELAGSNFDLLVTAQSLDFNGDGLEVALQAKRATATLPIIILAESTDDEPSDSDKSLFTYLRRPVMPESLLREIRIALEGPEAVAHQPSQGEAPIPVPEVEYGKLSPKVFELMSEVRAMAAVLATRAGKVIGYEGAAGYIDRDLIAAALGVAFGATIKVMSVIGEQPKLLSYYQGDKRDMFALAVGLHFSVILVFDGAAPTTALAAVRRFGTQTAADMVQIITPEVAYSTKAVISAKPAEPPNRRLRRIRTEENATVISPVRPTPPPEVIPSPRPIEPTLQARRAPPAPVPAPAPMPEAKPIANFDASIFDSLGSVDTSSADFLFSAEPITPGPRPDPNNADGDSPRLSFEDAFMQGIIGSIDDK